MKASSGSSETSCASAPAASATRSPARPRAGASSARCAGPRRRANPRAVPCRRSSRASGARPPSRSARRPIIAARPRRRTPATHRHGAGTPPARGDAARAASEPRLRRPADRRSRETDPRRARRRRRRRSTDAPQRPRCAAKTRSSTSIAGCAAWPRAHNDASVRSSASTSADADGSVRAGSARGRVRIDELCQDFARRDLPHVTGDVWHDGDLAPHELPRRRNDRRVRRGAPAARGHRRGSRRHVRGCDSCRALVLLALAAHAGHAGDRRGGDVARPPRPGAAPEAEPPRLPGAPPIGRYTVLDAGRARRHGRGLRGLRSGAGSADRAQDPAVEHRSRGRPERRAGCCARRRRSPSFATPTSSSSTTPAASPIASSSRWSSSTASTLAAWLDASSRARRRADPRGLLARPAAACRPRTPPGSFTATSSRRT